MDGWIKIYSSDQPHAVELAKGILFENDIEAVPVSLKDSVYIFGEIELYVRVEEEILAKLILNRHHL